MIVEYNLWNPYDQIKIGLPNHLSGSPINGISRSPIWILLNLNK
jgi:hypothetical protein